MPYKDPKKRAEKCKEYYEKNKEKIDSYRKKYYEENKNEILNKKKKYHDNNKEHINIKSKKYYEEHKEDLADYRKKYYETNREILLIQKKEYTRNHKDEKSIYDSLYYKQNEERKKEYHKSPMGIFSRYKSSAKKRKRSFELSFDDYLNNFSHSKCCYCGNDSTGIDRVDSKHGYVLENCVPCCEMCNKMKLDHSSDEFYEQIIKIYQKYIFDKS